LGIIAPTRIKPHTRIKAPLRHRNFYYSPGYNSREYGRATLRSRSLDCAADRSSPEAEDEEAVCGQRFVVLADYMALTSREIDLNEDEVVELIKVGCAGWWYVRITTYPYPEGWAPSTYLEKIA